VTFVYISTLSNFDVTGDGGISITMVGWVSLGSLVIIPGSIRITRAIFSVFHKLYLCTWDIFASES